MVYILAWNVKGLNAPNKQKKVIHLCNERSVGLVGLLETKVKESRVDNIVNSMFGGW